MNNYPLRVMSYSRRLMLVVGLLIGVFFFPTKSVEMRVCSAPSEENLVLGKFAYSRTQMFLGIRPTNIYTANADGSEQTVIDTSGFAYEPAWSPDGSKVVYFTGLLMKSNSDIYVINPDGTNRINLTNTQGIDERNPSWSVTDKIAYERGGQIWTINADGSNQAVFSAITQPAPVSPAWSFDGTKLAFASGGEIWVIDADGTNERRITINITTDNDPAWSPDGSKIAFTGGTTGIGVINVDGTNEMILTSGNDRKPSWSSDNTKIAFVRGGTTFTDGIYVMKTDGTNQIRILTNGLQVFYSDPAWQPVRVPHSTQFDFDGDGRADLSVFRQSNTVWYWLGSQSGVNAVQWGLEDDFLAPADYDGDLKTDIAVWREVGADGVFYILNSSTGTFRFETFGLPGDIPTPSDWDSDGKADLSVYRGAQGMFYYRGSINNPNGNITFVPWGTSDDKPVSGDFDGDSKTDAAVFRPSNGTWYIRKSSDGQVLAVNFGLVSDKLVPADYDGDLRTDLAVYRDGVWYVQRSTQGFTAFQFGIASDTPAPADYDGDGRADAAVFRNGVWYVLKSQSGNTEVTSFGVGGDKAVPSAYVR